MKKNASACADQLVKKGYTICTGGTENHLLLWYVFILYLPCWRVALTSADKELMLSCPLRVRLWHVNRPIVIADLLMQLCSLHVRLSRSGLSRQRKYVISEIRGVKHV